MEQNLKAGRSDTSLTAATRLEFRAKVRRAAEDNPELPACFIADSLKGLAEPREDSAPFMPRGRIGSPKTKPSTGI